MASVEIDDPVLLDTFETDSKGRVNLGEKYADKEVEICVVNVNDP